MATFAVMLRLALLFNLFISVDGAACQGKSNDSTVMVFWNVENLFYPERDTSIFDEAFTPSGDHHWTWYRYHEKLDKVAKTLIATGRWRQPAIVGLCEIENCYVVEDLIKHTPLEGRYRFVHRDSPDHRGIDVSLMYDPLQVNIIDTKWLPLADTNSDSSIYILPTREILRTTVVMHGGSDTINIYVNHWPSRYSGQLTSEPRRILASRTLRRDIDREVEEHPERQTIICGDFNDHPEDRSIRELIRKAQPKLINKMNTHSGQGTHKYAGEWGILDMFIVSRELQKRSQSTIFRGEWLLEKEARHLGFRPHRTFQGPVYKGGYSDHLPIVLVIGPE